jgi:hypothetical protein
MAHNMTTPNPMELSEKIMPFSVYPNPLTSKKLVITLGFATQASEVTFSISNVLGQTVFNHKLTSRDYATGTFTADLSSLSLEKGIYLMKMTMDGKTNVQKLVIK